MSGDGLPAPKPLAWPPLADDLRRLYIEEGLSASKIARAYGLRYASDKTAESTVLYHLKKNGIARRDPAAHVRKVTEEMVDEWAARYEKGESLKQIAGASVDAVTVFNHLHRRGLKLRDKVEAQIKAVKKFEKVPFSNDPHEKAYLVGLSLGDLTASMHGRAVRAKISTTHPQMARLFRELFGRHGPIYEYPRKSELTEFEWSLDCDLDASYSFLLDLAKVADEVIPDDDLFYAFLAGFFDADGSLYFHKKHRSGAFEFSLSNMNEPLLLKISTKLSGLGFTPHLRLSRQTKDRGVMNGADYIWKLTLWKHAEVNRLLKRLPIRHGEKKAKAEIALRLAFRERRIQRRHLVGEWDKLRASIAEERLAYIQMAREILSYADANKPKTGLVR